jgi:hypothetical protein
MSNTALQWPSVFRAPIKDNCKYHQQIQNSIRLVSWFEVRLCSANTKIHSQASLHVPCIIQTPCPHVGYLPWKVRTSRTTAVRLQSCRVHCWSRRKFDQRFLHRPGLHMTSTYSIPGLCLWLVLSHFVSVQSDWKSHLKLMASSHCHIYSKDLRPTIGPPLRLEEGNTQKRPTSRDRACRISREPCHNKSTCFISRVCSCKSTTLIVFGKATMQGVAATLSC